MKKQYAVTLFCIVSLLFLLTSTTAFAAGESLFERHDTVIPEKQMVENVVVIGGDATISGAVRDAVIVINGNLKVRETSRIMGLVLVVGGTVELEPGAQLTDNVFSVTFDNATMNSLLIGGALLAGFWFLRFVISLLMVILPVLTVLLARDRIGPFVALVRRSPGRLLGIGLATSFLLTAVGILLSITIIGIPVVAVLLLGTLLIFLFGLSTISIIIGEWVPGTAGRSSWLTAAGGAVAVAAGINFPFLGGFLLLGLFWISLGMTVSWFWNRRRRQET